MSAKTSTPIWDNHRRDFDLADPDLVKPDEADALEQGEWVSFDSAGKAIRAAAASNNAFQVWSERGDYSAQALGKVAVLFYRDYEVDTDIFETLGTFTIGTNVTIKQLTVDGVTRACFTDAITPGTDYIYGVVTQIPANNNGDLRVKCCSPYMSNS